VTEDRRKEEKRRKWAANAYWPISSSRFKPSRASLRAEFPSRAQLPEPAFAADTRAGPFHPLSPATSRPMVSFFLFNPDTRGPYVSVSCETDWWTPLTADPTDLAVDPLTVDLVS